MQDDDNMMNSDDLLLDDLRPAMAACLTGDPGPDPTWDPDPYPGDDTRLEGLPSQ